MYGLPVSAGSTQEITPAACTTAGVVHWSRAALVLQRTRRGAVRIPLRGNRGSGSTSKSASVAGETPREEVRKAVTVEEEVAGKTMVRPEITVLTPGQAKTIQDKQVMEVPSPQDGGQNGGNTVVAESGILLPSQVNGRTEELRIRTGDTPLSQRNSKEFVPLQAVDSYSQSLRFGLYRAHNFYHP
ncbi:hypothetical protein NDU88_000423 [Pleurodeles waltl]|uniref:Uncharacterized protein n=1 Tax=Pleurodeles waltl TaxID=8319 RepID=A0AAV7V5Z6_PLEWA|nr:hypothetical protein NDU88_000423 [Pleurodeles waltl]